MNTLIKVTAVMFALFFVAACGSSNPVSVEGYDGHQPEQSDMFDDETPTYGPIDGLPDGLDQPFS